MKLPITWSCAYDICGPFTFSLEKVQNSGSIWKSKCQYIHTMQRVVLIYTGNQPIHRMGYPDPSAFWNNVGYVLAEEICFIFTFFIDIELWTQSLSMKQISFAKTCPTLLQKAEGSGYPSPCIHYMYYHVIFITELSSDSLKPFSHDFQVPAFQDLLSALKLQLCIRLGYRSKS